MSAAKPIDEGRVTRDAGQVVNHRSSIVLHLTGRAGNRAAHNLIHNAPHIAIGFGGNEHVIEFNEIHDVCLELNDAGAIYAGRDWTMRGTVIRHNYLHDITGFEGRGWASVYLDDMFCGSPREMGRNKQGSKTSDESNISRSKREIYGNVFYKVTRAAFIGGERDCTVKARPRRTRDEERGTQRPSSFRLSSIIIKITRCSAGRSRGLLNRHRGALAAALS